MNNIPVPVISTNTLTSQLCGINTGLLSQKVNIVKCFGKCVNKYRSGQYEIANKILNWRQFIINSKGKGKDHPITGHQGHRGGVEV
jgi:hypothetical protein